VELLGVLYDTRHKSKDQTYRLCIQARAQNYTIVQEKTTDFAAGFDVLCNPRRGLSWDTSYLEFLQLNIAELYQVESGIFYFKFNYAVRICSLVLQTLEFFFSKDSVNIAV